MGLRVAVLSFDGLPDPRVEREMDTLLRLGNEVLFIGPLKGGYCRIFGKEVNGLKCIHPHISKRAVANFIEPLVSKYAKKIKSIIYSYKADIVLAINIPSAYIGSKIDLPLIIDNHEYFYLMVKYYPLFGLPNMSLRRRITYTLGNLRRRWVYQVRKIEAKLAGQYPMIFTNSFALNDFSKRFSISKSKLYVLKNYPSRHEIRDNYNQVNNVEDSRLHVIYISAHAELDANGFIPFRDISLTIKTLCEHAYKNIEALLIGTKENIDCFKGVGWLDTPEILRLLRIGDIGIASWYPHPLHHYVNPNKPYFYAVNGGIPIVSESLSSVIEDMPWNPYIVKTDYFKDNLRNIINELISMHPDERIDISSKIAINARHNLLWEQQEYVLLEAISKA